MLGFVRRFVRAVCVFGIVMIACAPVLLGPATGAALRMLGGDVSHKCACGMKPGTCGCPECERLEKQRQEDARPRPYQALKPSCDPASVLAVTGTAPFVLAASPGALLPAPRVSYPLEAFGLELATQVTLEPATPPPRSFSA